jgi:preprotein translocase subunit YajC
MVTILGKQLEEKQEQQLKVTVILLLAGLGFYFFIYLPQQEKAELDQALLSDIIKTQTLQASEYGNHLARLRSYQK